MKYSFENQSFDGCDVEFNTSSTVMNTGPQQYEDENSCTSVLPQYQIVENEPNILTMIVKAQPTIDVEIEYCEDKKRIVISKKPNDFVQEEGGAYLHHTKTIEMIDTTKYTHFVMKTIDFN